MSLSTRRHHQAIRVDQRRQLVAALLLRNPFASQRQIYDKLAETFVNPDTDKPYSLGTINADMQALREEWRERAAGDIAEYKARLLAELDEVTREAWKTSDLRSVLAALKQKREVLGLDAPQRHDVTSGGEALTVVLKWPEQDDAAS